ncbi:MarR family winged helix-turn-helix transcriptional regulator [Modestobacter sp. VKM Ac-2979]|uniref:MarR family winged helix-turn-helix transcriptional regulator n=1 Tax=unclassified Modestobacter TaxID=2643866 RepID=UPI0022ABC06A|nr:MULTISPECIES: MarR family winged helix-turn-helix transcriptional regulator [unclassified Modestobacter]MCZ2813361.1 MarR family winged helix-turn-helix transcriptional regulator [Modestobacter sp. VKM Ac-2979]MCZ2842447.1 MarR family winged helix-turn-helix transcriptional regulator [Modestobacter sp. VKM Ac-2980]
MDIELDRPGLTDDVGFLLSRASGRLVRASNAVLAGHGLRVRPWSVLVLACDAAEGISQRELADVLGLDPSQIVLLVDELTAAGRVERRPSPADRRNKLVLGTAAGQAVRTAAARDVELALAGELTDFSAGERQLLQELLTRLVFGGGPAAGRG